MRILLLSNSKNPGSRLLEHAGREIRGLLGGAVKTVLFVPFAGVAEPWGVYAGRVREAFGIDLPLQRVFEAPTLAGLASVVDAAREHALLLALAEVEGLSDEKVRALLAAGSAAQEA